MAGPVALVGSGEFLTAMGAVDRELLAAIPRERPRVVILPTASWPDGDIVFRRWASMGEQHFRELGAEVESLLVREPADGDDDWAVQVVGEADLVYLSGGKPDHLRRVLTGSRLGGALLEAHERGAVLAGCSAGAMVLAEHLPGFRRRMLPWPLRWDAGLGIVGRAAVLPHYDVWPQPVTAAMALQAPRDCVVLGIDEETAVVGRDGAWQVRGRGRVTVWRGSRRERFRRGGAFRI
jgi:cyanophycinase